MDDYDCDVIYSELFRQTMRTKLSKSLRELANFLTDFLPEVYENLDLDILKTKTDKLITKMDEYNDFLERGFFIFQETSDIINYGGLDIMIKILTERRPDLAKRLVFASSFGDIVIIRLEGINFEMSNYLTGKFELTYKKDNTQHKILIDTNDIYQGQSSYPMVFDSPAQNEVLNYLIAFSSSINYERERRMFYYDEMMEKFIFF